MISSSDNSCSSSLPARRPFFGWQFDNSRQRWVPAAAATEHCEIDGKLSIATWNVLFDSKDPSKPCSDRPEILWHEERHTKVLSELAELDSGTHKQPCHVIGLQEVTPMFLRKLLAEDWARKKYFVSAVLRHGEADHTVADAVDSHDANLTDIIRNSQGSMLLSKIPFSSLNAHPGHEEAVVGLLKVQSGKCIAGKPDTILICSAHLRAFPYLTEGIRSRQLRSICDYVEEFPDWNHAVVFGDFNFHRESESKNIPDHWLEFEEAKLTENCSWSYSRNTMLQHYLPYFWWGSILPVDSLELRLDRIIYRSRNETQLSAKVTLFGNNPVYPERHKAGALSGRELWGKHRNVPVDEYLLPSDHFGIRLDVGLDGLN